jgi:tetratricopeptide (TPR) repeat protein
VVDCLTKAAALEPKKARELRWLLAQAYQDLHDDVKRDKILREVVTDGGDEGVAAMSKLAEIADKNGRFDQAEDLLRKCVLARPADATYRLALGKQYLQRRDDPAVLKRAVNELEAAVSAAPQNPDAFYQLGVAYKAANRTDDSIMALRHGIDLAPDVGDGYQALSKVLEAAGHREEAREMQATFLRYRSFEQSRQTLVARVNREPKNSEYRLRLAQFLLRAKDFSAAAGQFRSCLVINPSDVHARAGIAEAFRSMGRTPTLATTASALGETAAMVD